MTNPRSLALPSGRAARVGRQIAIIVALGSLVALGPGAGRAMAAGGTEDAAWKQGNDAYLRGDYAAAILAYEELDRQRVSSPELAFNLGNAYYRSGQLGRAVWAWERALALAPDHEDARYNLDQARRIAERRVRDKLEGAEREPIWIRAVGELSLSTELWLFLACYVGFFAALATRVWMRRRRERDETPVLGALCALLGVAAALAGSLLVGRVALERVPFAIVLPDAVAVKEGASATYKTSFEIHAGLRVRLLDRDQDWVRVRLANGLEGWVPDRDVGTL